MTQPPAFAMLGGRRLFAVRRTYGSIQPVGHITMAAGMGKRRMPAIIRPMVPSEQLKQFVGDHVQPRSDVLRVLNQYVKEHNLQDPRDKRMVVCDDKLRDLLGVEKCTILALSKYVTPHLLKPEDVGGRYVREAEQIEEKYLEEKADAKPKQESNSGRRRRKAIGEEDKQQGRRLFKPVLLSDELSAVCRGQKEMSRQQVVKAVWEYIRLNNLNANPGEPIRCDYLLKRVFNSDTVSVTAIMKGIGMHLTKKP